MSNDELKPCPFCGGIPEIPDYHGVFYEFECNCGIASIAIQISDLMTIEERATESFINHRHSKEYVERAKREAVLRWNRRI